MILVKTILNLNIVQADVSFSYM